MKTPILFLVFNRPDLTKRVFEAIRAARPPRLFIAADGPRAHKPGEAEVCEQTRAVCRKVDWDCEVHTLFRDQNLGCKRAVSGGISWFFEHVEEGIILEDDCLPEMSFFPFCEELLAKYRNNPEVVSIGGSNFQDKANWKDNGYYFSNYGHIWGWATWRRAWAGYQLDLKDWIKLKPTSWLQKRLKNKAACAYWAAIFDRCAAGEIDTWDFQWTFSGWVQGGKAILPGVNLVQNIGFDERATHTTGQSSWLSHLTKPIQSPLEPWLGETINQAADSYTNQHVFRIYQPTFRARLKAVMIRFWDKTKRVLLQVLPPLFPKRSC